MKRILFGAFFSLGCLIVLGFAPIAFAEEFDSAQRCDLNGLSGIYYRIDEKNASLSETLARSDFFKDDQKILQGPVDIRLFDLPQTDERRFPDKNYLPGAPEYFAARWSGVVVIPQDGMYRVTLSSHEESQLFIDGREAITVHSNHDYGGRMIWMNFKAGTSTIDIYFAKRSDFNTGLVFRIEGDGVRFSPCRPELDTVQGGNVDSAQKDSLLHIFSTPPSNEVTSGSLYIYDVEARGEDNETLAFQLIEAPPGMMIVPSTGFVFWRPINSDAKPVHHRVAIVVSDKAHSAYQNFELSVSIPVTNSVLSQASNNIDNSDTSAVAVEPTALTDQSTQESSIVLSHAQTADDAGSQLSVTALFTGVFSSLVAIKTQLRYFVFFILVVLIVSVLFYGILEVTNTFKLRARFRSIVIEQNNARLAREEN